MGRAFSATMAELRRRRGISQRAAAAELHISQALLSHYENGAREPGLDFLCRASEYYGVTADYLLGLSEWGGPGDREKLTALLDELRQLSARIENTLGGPDT